MRVFNDIYLIMQIHETALKDMTNKLTHQFAFPIKTCNKFGFNFIKDS